MNKKMAESVAHFLYWSGYLDYQTEDIQAIVIVPKNNVNHQCGIATFEHLKESLDELYPDWRSWNHLYKQS